MHHLVIRRKETNKTKQQQKKMMKWPTFPCIIIRIVILTNDESTLLIGSVAIFVVFFKFFNFNLFPIFLHKF